MNVIVDNLAVHYIDQGSGSVVLLLHGWQDSVQSFQPFIHLLAKNYRVIAPDLPGFGNTEAPAQAWNIQNYADFVQAFCQKLDIKPIVIVGHSMGARIAIRLVAHNLLTTEKLILISAAGISQSKSVRVRTLNTIANAGTTLTNLPGLKRSQDSFRRRYRKAVGASDYDTAGSMRPTLLNILREDLQLDATKINTPTLLIYGENDQDTPLKFAHRLNSLILDSKLKTVPNAAHFVHIDQLTQVINDIEEFIK